MNDEDSTWKQMERCLKQEGYREGAAQGRDTSFQKGFDDGYVDGFKIAQLMGEVQATAKLNEILNTTTQEETSSNTLERATRANCSLCKHSNPNQLKTALPDHVYDQTYSDIVEDQRKSNDDLQSQLLLKLSR